MPAVCQFRRVRVQGVRTLFSISSGVRMEEKHFSQLPRQDNSRVRPDVSVYSVVKDRSDNALIVFEAKIWFRHKYASWKWTRVR